MTTQEKVPGINSKKSFSYFKEFNNKLADDAADFSFIIPGLNKTVSHSSEKKYYEVDTMVPQGMCRAGSYILISAYDSKDEAKSVIYVLNKDRQLIKTLIMSTGHHAGGLAYDSENKLVLVARSAYSGLSAISMDSINEALEKERSYVRIAYTIDLSVPEVKAPSASGLTYYNGRVYIFSFNTGAKSVCCCYKPKYDAEARTYELKHKYTFQLPNYTQGVTVARSRKKTRLFVSVSYGRSRSMNTYVSNLYTYYFDEKTGEKKLDNILACPPMLEQTFSYKGRMYCLFECGAKEYREVNGNPVDRVAVLKTSKLCDEKKGSVLNLTIKNAIGGKRVSAQLDGSKLSPYSSVYLMPYYSRDMIIPYNPFKAYTATESSTVYAVAVYKGRIVACDTISFTVKQVKTPTRPKSVKRTADYAKIKWTKIKGAEGYYVYRSAKRKGKYKRIGRTKRLSFTDKKAKSDKTYYYKIKAYRSGYKTSAASPALKQKAIN
jgi:hypothetical protein